MNDPQAPNVRIERTLPHHPLPRPAHEGDAGYDVYACLRGKEHEVKVFRGEARNDNLAQDLPPEGDAGEITIAPGERALIPLGFRIAVPAGWMVEVRPRSGLAIKHGVTIANTPGTIDSTYRGECAAVVLNAGQEPFTIQHEMRIAQIVFTRYGRPEFTEGGVDETERGAGGFGSTGL